MKKSSAIIGVVLAALLLSMSIVSAETFSLVDERYLPVKSVNDPISHENVKITKLSYEQLEFYMYNSPNFLRRNHGKRVCESMQIMFGKVPERCRNLPLIRQSIYVPPVYVSPAIGTGMTTVRPVSTGPARVTFAIQQPRYHSPRPKVSSSRTGVIFVDPIALPYGQVYSPYAWT